MLCDTMKPVCEIIVGRILPTIRAMVVKDLIKRYKLSQVEVAKKLGITQPAVSQYVGAMRGKGEIEKILSRTVGKDIKNLSDDIASGKLKQAEVIKRYCAICKEIKRKEVLCVF
jgi:predicted transcriptional regulator